MWEHYSSYTLPMIEVPFWIDFIYIYRGDFIRHPRILIDPVRRRENFRRQSRKGRLTATYTMMLPVEQIDRKEGRRPNDAQIAHCKQSPHPHSFHTLRSSDFVVQFLSFITRYTILSC